MDKSGQIWTSLVKFGRGYHGLVLYITFVAQGPISLEELTMAGEGGGKGEGRPIDMPALPQVKN